MAQHVLIVCAACHCSREHEATSQDADGSRLLHQLRALHAQWPRQQDLAIETTTCLCICERPCAIAYVGTGKPTYLFGDLPPDSAADLLSVAELYLDSNDGMVPAYQLPASLRSRRIARIPAAPQG